MQEFTEHPLSCPKCGNALITRKYDAGFATPLVLGSGRECLSCHRNECGYEWEQKTKDAYLVKPGLIGDE